MGLWLLLLFGSNNLPPDQVLAVFNGTASEQTQTIVTEQRIPRTLVGLAAVLRWRPPVALMQSLTRNPLAEPGLMGVNAGAAVAVIASVVVLRDGHLAVHGCCDDWWCVGCGAGTRWVVAVTGRL